jgi:hypothetical protein
MQFTIEEVHAVQPWAIRNATGNRHISQFFATQQEAQTFAIAMNQAWEKQERKNLTKCIEAAKALTPQA